MNEHIDQQTLATGTTSHGRRPSRVDVILDLIDRVLAECEPRGVDRQRAARYQSDADLFTGAAA